MSYIYTSDPSHGWIKVPLAELKELGIEKDISSYSYHGKGDKIYLEEDSDASKWVDALAKRDGVEPKSLFDEMYKNGEIVFKNVETTSIRRMPSYNSERV